MPKIQVNDISMFYEIEGEGEPLIFIGGFGVDHTTWKIVADKFKNFYQVILIDNRGAGQTDAPENSYSIKQMADDVAELCQKLKINKAHFVGNSMGGFIVQALIFYHQDLIQSAVISNSVIKSQSNFGLYLKAQLELIKIQTPLEILIQASCSWVHSFQFLSQPDVLKNIIRLTLENPFPFTLAGYQGQFAALENFDSSEWLNKMNVPVLVLAADQDLIFNQTQVLNLSQRISHANYFCFTQCGHLPFIEYPDQFFQIVNSFIHDHA